MNTLAQKRPAAPQTVSYDGLRNFSAKALERVGLSEGDAKIGADSLGLTDAWGIFTHGNKCLIYYLSRLKAGGLRPRGKPHIVSEGAGWAMVDGDSSLAMVTSHFAMRTAMAKARQCGIAYVGVRNSCHFGAAGAYTWLAASEGLIGLSMANDKPSVAAPGSRAAITGSNPISYAIPAGRYRPIMLDMAVATVAGGKVWEAQNRGEQIPNTWLLDERGKPTTDPSGYGKVGALQPAAGHKGYGIALLIETLAAVLSGAAITNEVKNYNWHDPAKPTEHGAAFIAIDINAMMPASQFAGRIEHLIDEIHNAPKAEGSDRIFLPGEKEWERYEHSIKEGISLPAEVMESLQGAAELCGLDLEKDLK
jgi:ureidoglycolate dehydrogenase (NAD+)